MILKTFREIRALHSTIYDLLLTGTIISAICLYFHDSIPLSIMKFVAIPIVIIPLFFSGINALGFMLSMISDPEEPTYNNRGKIIA